MGRPVKREEEDTWTNYSKRQYREGLKDHDKEQSDAFMKDPLFHDSMDRIREDEAYYKQSKEDIAKSDVFRKKVIDIKDQIRFDKELDDPVKQQLVKTLTDAEQSGSVHYKVYEKAYQDELTKVRERNKQREARLNTNSLTAQSRGDLSTILGGSTTNELDSILGGS